MKGKNSKKLLMSAIGIFFVLAVMPGMAYAEVPETINYQGYLTDDSGDPVNETVNINFRIYDSDSGGSTRWVEFHNGGFENPPQVQVTNGIFNVILGETNPLTSSVLDGNRWLSVQVGTDAEMTPRHRLSSVAYAIRAGEAEDLNCTGCVSQTELTFTPGEITGVTAGNGLTGGGSSGSVTLNVGSGNGILVDSNTVALNILYTNGLYAPVSHFHSAADITSGTLYNGRFSAYSDLSAEAYLGNAAGDLAQNNGTLQSTLNADRLDGLHASSFLTSESDPQVGSNTTNYIPKWNGSALVKGAIYDNGTNVGIGTTSPDTPLDVETSGSIATRSLATATGAGINYGGYFEAYRDSGRGVAGATNGAYAEGVHGEASGSYGKGVYGEASNTGTVTYYGGYFKAAGTSGRAFHGYASNTGTGTNYGGYFHAEGTGANAAGVYGRSDSNNGFGVAGHNYASGVGVGAWSYSGNLIEAYDGDFPGGALRFYVNQSGYAWAAGGHGPFTGAHEVKLADYFPDGVRAGMVVSVTGQTQISQTEHGTIAISSTLPTVELSRTSNDKTILGVFVSETPLHNKHWYQAKDSERFALVNALGEGRVWVSDMNGAVEAGDYVTTSSIPGYGQKQDDDLLHSYTLGKAIETVDWDSVTETAEYGGKTYTVYLIAVIYTSG